jgi:hypothetical protein
MVIHRITTAEEDAAIAAATAQFNQERALVHEAARTPEAFVMHFLDSKIAACVHGFRQQQADDLSAVYAEATADERAALDALRAKYRKP